MRFWRVRVVVTQLIAAEALKQGGDVKHLVRRLRSALAGMEASARRAYRMRTCNGTIVDDGYSYSDDDDDE
jgi:hypothetical protein